MITPACSFCKNDSLRKQLTNAQLSLCQALRSKKKFPLNRLSTGCAQMVPNGGPGERGSTRGVTVRPGIEISVARRHACEAETLIQAFGRRVALVNHDQHAGGRQLASPLQRPL